MGLARTVKALSHILHLNSDVKSTITWVREGPLSKGHFMGQCYLGITFVGWEKTWTEKILLWWRSTQNLIHRELCSWMAFHHSHEPRALTFPISGFTSYCLWSASGRRPYHWVKLSSLSWRQFLENQLLSHELPVGGEWMPQSQKAHHNIHYRGQQKDSSFSSTLTSACKRA